METLQLPYKINDLEPYLSEECMASQFHQYQVNFRKLKYLISGTIFENTDITTLIKISRGRLQYSAIQVWNSAFFLSGIKPLGAKLRKGTFMFAINGCFGSFKYLKELLIRYGSQGVGAGWIWLVVNTDGSIEIIKDNGSVHPLLKGYWPVFNFNLESYILRDNGQKCASYIETVLKLADWEIIEIRYQHALRQISEMVTHTR